MTFDYPASRDNGTLLFQLEELEQEDFSDVENYWLVLLLRRLKDEALLDLPARRFRGGFEYFPS